MKISNSEINLLEVLWQEHPLTVGQVIERAQQITDWHGNTIKTMLTRLTEKKAVERYKDGRRFFYIPVVSREEIVSRETEGFLKQFFGGQMAPLIAHFADRKKLTKKDITEIEEILARLKTS